MPLVSKEVRLLFGLLGRHKARYAFGCFFLACSDVGQLAVPYLIGRAVDGLAGHTLDRAGLLWIVAGVVVAAGFTAAVRYGWRYFVFGAGRLIDRDVRAELYAHLQTLDAAYFARTKIGDLMAHATNDVNAMRAFAGEGVMAGWDAIAMAVLNATMMFLTVDPRLAAVSLLPLLALPPVSYAIGRRVHTRVERVQAAFSTLSDRVQENVAGIRVVKGFAREDEQVARFDEANGRYRDAYEHLSRIEVGWDPIIHLLAGTAAVTGLVYGAHLVGRGELTVGQYVAFDTYLALMVWPMLALGWTMNILRRGTASIGRLQALFDARPAVADAPGAKALPAPRGEVRVRGLGFRYAPDGPAVLDGVDLDLSPGRTVGILGATGAGKTTLAALLVRAFDPPRGTVTIDGADVLDVRLDDLRRAVAYVPQDTFLFSRTIAENVAFDPAPHDAAAIRAAAELAQLGPDLARMPHGLETEIGERGVTLSGGQRQRVGIARALLKEAPILVLDDCMSAVDAATEAKLLAGVRAAGAARACLLISNRTAALATCDEIAVLRDGRITERGTHAELVALGGEYARVNRQQQLEAAIEGLA